MNYLFAIIVIILIIIIYQCQQITRVDSTLGGYWLCDRDFAEDYGISNITLFIDEPTVMCLPAREITRDAYLIITNDTNEPIYNNKLTLTYTVPFSVDPYRVTVKIKYFGDANNVRDTVIKEDIEDKEDAGIWGKNPTITLDSKNLCIVIKDKKNLYAVLWRDNASTAATRDARDSTNKKNTDNLELTDSYEDNLSSDDNDPSDNDDMKDEK